MNANSLFSSLVLGWALFLGFPPEEAKAGAWSFEGLLIWGTDKEKPGDPNLKAVDPKLVERLQTVFKWKYYYQVNKVPFLVPEKGAKKVKLSDKCEVKVRDLGKPMIEVELFGQGNLVKKITHKAVNCLVMAGDDKNATAWFVVLTPE